jgi:hypothetical protein
MSGWSENMRRNSKATAAILSASTAAIVLGAVGHARAQSVEVAQWSADTFAGTTSNWTDSIGGVVATSHGNNTLIPNAFGTHAGINVLGGGFSVPSTVATPPGNLTSFTVAAVYEPTAIDVTGGAGWQVQSIYGFDIGGAGVPDMALGFGGGSGQSFIAGGGNIGNGDYTLTSPAEAINTVHAVVYSVEGANGAAGAGVATLYVDGVQVAQDTGLTIQPIQPENGGTFGLGGQFGSTPNHGILGLVQVYNDSNGATNGLALSASLAQQYGGFSESYVFNVSSGAYDAASSYQAGFSPAADVNAIVQVNNGGTATIGSSDNIINAALYIGTNNTSTGTVVQTGGSLTVGTFGLGNANGTGTLNISGGTFNFNSSSQLNIVSSTTTASTISVGGTGTFLSNLGANISFGEGNGASGVLNITGGTFNAGSGQVFLGDTGGTGVLNVSGGTLIVDNWLAPGRNNQGGGGNTSTGTINLTGGTILKVANSNGNIDIAGDGANANAVFNQSGGTVTALGSSLWVAENGANTTLGTAADNGVYNFSGGTATYGAMYAGLGGNGTVNMSGTANLTVIGLAIVGVNSGSVGVWNINGGTANASSVGIAANIGSTGTLNLNGGVLSTGGVTLGAGTPMLNLSGGTLQASENTGSFVTAPLAGQVQLLAASTIDTQTYTANISATITGTGPLIKIGTGTLTLSGSNSYTGNTQVNAGTLSIANSAALGSGSAVLGNHTTLALAPLPAVINLSNFNPGGNGLFTPTISASGLSATLTTPTNSESTSLFSPNQYTISDSTGFVASFTFTHGNATTQGNAADGVVFVVQNVAATAYGGTGGAQGFVGIQNSVGAGVNLYLDEAEAGVNGAFTNTSALNSVPFISQYTSSNVLVVYNNSNGGTLTETITSNTNGSSFTLVTTGIDAAADLGGTAGGTASAWIGFTAATGGLNDLQGISNFAFSNTGTVLPTSATTITNAVQVSPAASSVIQLAGTTNYSYGAVGPITIGTGGTLAISIGSNAATGVLRGVLTTPSVTFASSTSGQVDIGVNALDITSQSLATVTAMVASGYSNGTWTGPGIVSSAAAADSNHLTALGVIVNNISGTQLYGSSGTLGMFDGANPASTDVLVKYTYYGDTTLKGYVNGSDYSRIDNAYITDQTSPGTLTGWFNGDFNYDGVINGSDYTLIDNAFNQQGASLAAQLASPTASIGGSAVPEPATLGLAAMGALALLGRRRRSH